MFPPSQTLNLDIEALSGICGSVSIACWVVVFTPQIVENFRRSSAEGLSIVFIIIWLLGDVFNILGAVLQGVLPTMIILAIYYTLADIVLLGQCFYYKGFTFTDKVPQKPSRNEAENGSAPSERTSLLPPGATGGNNHDSQSRAPRISDVERRRSLSAFREHLSHLDGTHLSPVTPLHPAQKPTSRRTSSMGPIRTVVDDPKKKEDPRSTLKAVLFNLSAILIVCAAGVLGWYVSARTQRPGDNQEDDSVPESDAGDLKFNILGQVFGYICAALYLGSRLPQLLLNYRRKSTEGISMLFFLFACIGNLTYVLSILAYKPVCRHYSEEERRYDLECRKGEAAPVYWRYFLVNLSWLVGSFGTLLLDAGVFVQYFLYLKDEDVEEEALYSDEEEDSVPDDAPRIHNGEGRGRSPNER